MKKLLAALILCLILPISATAQTGVAVSGTVPSVVSATNSTVTTDLTELPADGKSLVIITVTLRDGSGAIITSGKTISISSNRGNVDVVGVYDGAVLSTNTTTTSDSNGVAIFAARSNAPGQATFTVVADTVNLSAKPVITFTALPVLQNLTISIKIPEIIPGTTKITLVQPPATQSTGNINNSQLVNTKVELQLPFFVLVIGLVVFGVFLLLIITLIAIRNRLKEAIADQKKASEREEGLLKKIIELEGGITANQKVLAQNDKVISDKLNSA